MESAEPAKSAESAESAAGAGNESGRFIVQSLTEKTVGPDNGAVAAQICAAAGSSGKIGSADFSTNRGWTGRARQENSSGGHADESRLVGENRQRRFFDEQGLDAGPAGPGRKIRQGGTLTKTGAAAWKIGSADFSTNRGWALDRPGQAGKFVRGAR